MKIVTCFLTGLLLLAMSGQARAGILFDASYNADVVFSDALLSTTMTLTYDGTNYWSTRGGSSAGTTLARYDSSGSLLNSYATGNDFRSVFTNNAGDVFARTYNSNVILMQTSPGVFVNSGITLSTGLNDQSSVVLNGDQTEFLAHNNGTVQRWDLSGNFIASTSLSGWGSVAGEANYPQDRGIAAFGDYWLTYSNGTLSAWDTAGNRVDQTLLNGAGTTFNAHFSLSYANGRVFIVDDAGGSWRGYDIGDGRLAAVPEPATLAMFGLGAALIGVGSVMQHRRQQQRRAN